GKITGKFPSDEDSQTYFLAATTGSGSLFVRSQYSGPGDTPKEIEFAAMEDDRPGQPVSLRGSQPTDQQMQTLQMKAPGRHVFAVTVRGPEEAGFCIVLGGPAFPTTANVDCDLPAPPPPRASAPPPSPPPVAAAAPPDAPAPKDAPESCERRIRLE